MKSVDSSSVTDIGEAAVLDRAFLMIARTRTRRDKGFSADGDRIHYDVDIEGGPVLLASLLPIVLQKYGIDPMEAV